MKKLVVLLLVVLLPAFAFADFQIGGVGMYKGTIEQLKAKDVGVEDFTFGGEARIKLGIFQGGLTALYYPEDLTRSAAIVALTDVGLSFDLLFLRLGAGIGPNFAIPVGDSGAGDPLKLGLNMKLSTDFMLGKLSLGLVGFYYLESLKDLKNIGDVFKEMPWLGVTAMFKIF
jgi:hypothetical protein